jgi:transposase
MPRYRNCNGFLVSAITPCGSASGNWVSRLKKLIKYRERNEVQRWLFRRELEKLTPASVYYLDEHGVDHRLYREYGRALRGERIYATVADRHRERTSLIAAGQNGRLVAPLTFAGTRNTEVVDAYFAQVLLPGLPPGSVIVLDSARFHQSPTTAALAAAAGCALLFLPAYSPDLNPIEHLWAAIKACLRKGLPPPPTPAFLSAMPAYVIVKCYNLA